MSYTDNELKRFETFLEFHLTKDQRELPESQQIQILSKKKGRIRMLNIVNIVGALFFAYWFWAGITQLGNIFVYVIAGVFVLNMFALNVQRKQLADVLNYLEHKDSAQ